MKRGGPQEPAQLRVMGATDLEQRLLDGAARELPSVELTDRMKKALGISAAIGTAAVAARLADAAATSAATAAPVAAGTSSAAWTWLSAGVVALAMTGAAAVGVHWSSGRKPAEVIAAPAPPIPVAPAPEAAPVARPVAHAHHHAPVAGAPSDLRAEIALVDAARNAVARATGVRALALLDRYEATYPSGTFRPEATVLRVEALSSLGRTAEARALARKFIAAHPDSPLTARVSRQAGPTNR
ncbi:MAG TPA: hypothetical protein VHG72_13120 [Polyangia bacterium]|nr:hypothetical protein [Polyangia bacterium]